MSASASSDNLENVLLDKKNIFVCISEHWNGRPRNFHVDDLTSRFCGTVVTEMEDLVPYINDVTTRFYLTGLIDKFINVLHKEAKVYIIDDCVLSEEDIDPDIQKPTFNQTNWKYWQLIDYGQVPISIHGLGFQIRNAFNKGNLFDEISKAHGFQQLTQSAEETVALRTGIYISPVIACSENLPDEQQNAVEGKKYFLLRCSTNMKTGGTENLREPDRLVFEVVQEYAQDFFKYPCNLNHALAQIYNNQKEVVNGVVKHRKATISAHSDKTKDMESNGVMAFVTFYKEYSNAKEGSFVNLNGVRRSKIDPFDHVRKETSVLTVLRFRRKHGVVPTDTMPMPEMFDVVMYPNSIFLMSLQTNRLYTHEIMPAQGEVDQLPTRMGYVVRCSKQLAFYHTQQDNTYLYVDQKPVLMSKNMPNDQFAQVKELYARENQTTEFIQYPIVKSSMNLGDFLEPVL
jgi:hypothetical protein